MFSGRKALLSGGVFWFFGGFFGERKHSQEPPGPSFEFYFFGGFQGGARLAQQLSQKTREKPTSPTCAKREVFAP